MARRVNTRFILILAGGVIGLGVLGYAAVKLLVRARPDQYAALATEAEANHDWKTASFNWNQAIKADPHNPEYYVHLGTDMHHMALDNPEFANKEVGIWQQALEIQPGYVPAIRQLWIFWNQTRSENPGNVYALQHCAEQAANLIRADGTAKDIEEVKASLDICTIEEFVHGVPMDQSEIKNREDDMRDLIQADPTNAELPYYLAETEVHRGQQLAQNSSQETQPTAATALFQKAVTDMRAAVISQPRNPAMHFHLYQIYNELNGIDRTPADRPNYVQLCTDEIDQAESLLKGDEPLYTLISAQAALRSAALGQMQKAERIVSTLLKQRPNDLNVIFMARGVIESSPDLRPQAIDMLETMLNAAGPSDLVDVRRFNEMEVLTELQIPEMTETTSDAERDRIAAEIKGHLKLMTDSHINDQIVYGDEAELDFALKQYIDVIRVLNTAESADPKGFNANFQLVWTLAQAYTKVNEREQALEYCEKAVALIPNYLEPHEQLVHLLLTEHTDEARQRMAQEIDFLRRVGPDDPEVILLQITQMDPASQHDQIKALYDKLPENTLGMCWAKARLANEKLNNTKETIRLMEKASKIAPGDLPTTMLLAQAYASGNRLSDAILVVETALKAHPDNADLQAELTHLKGGSLADQRSIYQKYQEQSEDPAARAMESAEKAEAAGNFAEAEKNYKLAESTAPDDPEIWDHLFRLYLQTKDWDKQKPYLDKLSSTNRDQAHGLLYQFEIARAKADSDRMMQIGVQLTTDLPEFAKSYYYLGLAYEAQGKYQQAVENYEAALAKKGSTGDASQMLKAEIGCYYRMNRPDKALVALEEGRRRFPSEPWFEIEQIRHELEHGDPDAALADLKSLLPNNPNIPDLYLFTAQAQLQVAQNKQRTGETDEVADAMNAARDILAQGLARFLDDGRFYQQLAEVFRQMGNPRMAEKILTDMDARPSFHTAPDPQILLGELYILENRPDKAEEAYRAAFTRSKNNVQVEMLLCNMLIAEGKIDDALSLLDGANSTNPSIRRERIYVLIHAARFTEAKNALTELLAEHPADANDIELSLAQLEVNLGNPSVAFDHVNTVLTADPNNVGGLVMRAKLRMMQAPPDPDAALVDLNAARLLNPQSVDVLLAMAEVYNFRFDVPEVCRLLEAALRLQPTNVRLRCQLASTYASAIPPRLEQGLQVVLDGRSLPGGNKDPQLALTLAEIDQKLGKLQEAADTIKQALGDNPGNLDLLQTYLQMGLDDRQFSAVAQGASQVLSKHKDIWWALCDRGFSEAALGDHTAADRDLTNALAVTDAQHDAADGLTVVKTVASELGPGRAIELLTPRRGTNPEWDVLLVMLYHQNHQDDLAIQLLDSLLNPPTPLSRGEQIRRLSLAGLIYASANPDYPDKAFDAYQKLLAINPDDLTALNNLACLCADNFDPPKVQEGLTAVRRAMDILSKYGTADPSVEDTYGWLLILGGQTSQAMELLHKAAERGQFPEVHLHLAEGYLRMNRPEDANREVTIGLSIIAKLQEQNVPVNEETRRKLNDLSNRVLDSMNKTP
jgi:tetratricopeptide (TPR) repeat protein